MGIIAKIKDNITQFDMFRKGIMPPNERFNAHFTREIGKIMERYYPAAELGPHRADWNPSVLVDQNVYRLEYRRIYARAKRAYDTDPYARSCVRVLQSQIVGRGISPRAKPVDKNGNPLPDLGKLFNQHFERFADECFRPNHDSFYDVQSKYITNCCVSGGLFLNMVPAPKENIIPFAFQQIDQSYIEFSHDNFALPNAPMTYNGVEINEFGDPQQYFFQDLVTWMFFQMPASNMIHCYDKWHVNQFIGIPWLAPVLTTLWDLAQLQEDKLIASRIQAAIALWVKETSRFPNMSQKNNDGNIPWAPGKIIKSQDKPEIIQASDNIKDTFGALIELYLRQISSGMGVSYQEMTSDLAGANFASSRTVVMDRRRYYQKKQEFIIRSFCQPVYQKFVQWCFLAGLIPGKSILDYKANKWGYCRAAWTPDRWSWVDPVKDIQALIAERDAGWLPDEDYCEMVGKNRDNLYQTLADEKDQRKKLGIEIAPIIPVKNQTLSQEVNNAAEEK
jgi:lambda family phage portal protein